MRQLIALFLGMRPVPWNVPFSAPAIDDLMGLDRERNLLVKKIRQDTLISRA